MEGCDEVLGDLDTVTDMLTGAGQNLDAVVNSLIDRVSEMQLKYQTVDRDLNDEEAAELRGVMTEVKGNMTRLRQQHRNLHSSVSAVGKTIDKNFSRADKEIGLAFRRNTEVQEVYFTQLLALHLYSSGQIRAAEKFCQETGVGLDPKTIIKPHRELYGVLSYLKDQILEPVLLWCQKNKADLDARDSKLEFQLLRLEFIRLYKKNKRVDQEILLHFRKRLSPFAGRYEKEFLALMGCLMFRSNRIENTPYKYLMDQTLWNEVYETFRRDAGSCLGVPMKSKLAVVFDVGCAATPALTAALDYMKSKLNLEFPLNRSNELSLNFRLGEDLWFHSIFVCPILNVVSININLPFRLPCGHTICRDALARIFNTNPPEPGFRQAFRCPYCMSPYDPRMTRSLRF